MDASTAVSLYNSGNRAQAREVCKILLVGDPAEVNGLYILGMINIGNRDPLPALLHLARAWYLLKSNEAIAGAIEQALTVLLNEVDSLVKADQLSKAKDTLLSVPVWIPQFQHVATVIAAVGNMATIKGITLYRAGKVAQAFRQLQIAIACDNRNADAIFYSARLLAFSSAYAEAARMLCQLPDDQRDYKGAYWLRATYVARALNLYSENGKITLPREDPADPMNMITICRDVLKTYDRHPDAKLVCALADVLMGDGRGGAFNWTFVSSDRYRDSETIRLYQNLSDLMAAEGRWNDADFFDNLVKRTQESLEYFDINRFARWQVGWGLERASKDAEFRAYRRYLDLLIKSLHMTDPGMIDLVLGNKDLDLRTRDRNDDRTLFSLTLIGSERLQQLSEACQVVLREGIPGDFIETGVWRGGACILMRAVLDAYEVDDRRVFVADSFQGLPKPQENDYPVDAGSVFHGYDVFAVTSDVVRRNFERYGLLDDQVVFLVGWFKDTLNTDEIEKLAVLRLDGDMYQSTMESLSSLYHKVSPGGYVIVDDYNIGECKQAIIDFRECNGIADAMYRIDEHAIYWRKGRIQ